MLLPPSINHPPARSIATKDALGEEVDTYNYGEIA